MFLKTFTTNNVFFGCLIFFINRIKAHLLAIIKNKFSKLPFDIHKQSGRVLGVSSSGVRVLVSD